MTKVFFKRSVRRLGALLTAGLLIFGTGISAFADPGAADYNNYDESPAWSVTFNTEGKALVPNFTTTEFQNIFKSMQPGDDAEVILNLTNSYADAVNWYMDNDVLSSLEESGDSATAGGSYSYILTYVSPNSDVGTIELYNSNAVGGEYTNARTNVGLKEINNGYLQDYDANNVNSKGEAYFYLDQLAKDQTGRITLYVKLDGETQGNAYQDTLAELEMKFAVDLNAETTPTPAPSGSPTPTPRSSTPTNSTTRKAVKTGDENPNVLLIVLMAISGIVLLILAVIGVKTRRNQAAQTVNNDAADRMEDRSKGGKPIE